MKKSTLALILILLTSLYLNLYGNRWGLPVLWYPDEPETIEDIVLPMVRHMDPNPHNFNKPTLYYYFLGAVISPYVLYHHLTHNQDKSQETYMSVIATISRSAAAILGVLGVFLVFLIGRRIAGEAAGLYAALLLCVNLGWAASSHYAYMDVPMVSLLLAALFFALKYIDTLQVKWLYFAAMLAGFSISTKYNAALPVAVLFLVCQTARVVSNVRFEPDKKKKILPVFLSKEFFISVLLLVAAFLMGSPFVILDYRTFFSYIQKQMGVSQGYKVFEESHVWIKNFILLKEGFGTGVFLLLGIGFLVGLFRVFKHRDLRKVLLFLITIAYLSYIGTWRIMAFRYVLPMVPFIILIACSEIQFFRKPWRVFGMMLLGFAAILSLAYSWDGIRWYKKDTRVSAEAWIARNIPPECQVETYAYRMYLPKFPKNRQVYRISSDYVSEVVQYRKDMRKDAGITIKSVKKHARDQFTMEALRLRNPEFIVMSSFFEERFLPRKNQKEPLYPELTHYFEKLFYEKAGYRIVAKFENDKMHLFYLNPTILIYKRSG